MSDEDSTSIDVEIIDNIEEDLEQIEYEYMITSYGADLMIDGIVKRMRENGIVIPSFQRGFVWNLEKSSRFIESLLLGLPVPGIFLSRDPETNQLMVIDGQQRLRTLEFFYNEVFISRPFALKGVKSQYIGKKYSDLAPQDRRRLDDSLIHATIVKQDEPSEDNSSIYLIFERLNTGGMLLRPQEIRACIYWGTFNNLLRGLNSNTESWRSLFGRPHTRMRDQELILRFLALFYSFDTYSAPMKEFLNKFMSHNRNIDQSRAERFSINFSSTMNLITESIGINAFKPRGQFNAAVFDSVSIGIAQRLKNAPIENLKEIKTNYERLLKNSDFMSSVDASTTDVENVKRRIQMSIDIFSDVR